MRLTLVLVLATTLSLTAQAQEAFDPFPDGSSSRYHIDLTRVFPSPDAERADRAVLVREVDSLEAMRGKVIVSGASLLRALELNDGVQTKLARHSIYLYLRYAADTRDEKSRDDRDALHASVDSRTAFLRDEILRLSDERFAAFLRAEPKLKTYWWAVESTRRWRRHTLSEPEEKVLARTAATDLGWQFDLYQRLIARIAFATVTVNGQKMDVNAQRAAIAAGADRATREEAFRKRWEGFASERELFAFALIRLAASRNAVARLRHFDDAAEWSYFGRELTRPAVKSLIERVAANAGVYKSYQQLRADHIRNAMGCDDAHVWDLGAPPPGFTPPRFTIDEARRVITEATAPLGTDYARELAALLDPANGRMDIVPGPHRKSGGFSQGAIGTESVFFSAGFEGSYDNVRVLIHESTHAVQRELMTAAHVPMAYAQGPNYLAESLAIFNELVLADFMAVHATSPAQRQFYLEQFLDGKGMAAFFVAPEAELEEAVYDGVAAGTLRSADELDAVTKRVYDRYTIWPSREDALKHQWIAVPLMYEDPFYDVNYVYGALIALRMYATYKADPKAFAPQYVAMMKNGYDAPATALLKRFFGIDLDDPQLLTEVSALLTARVEALRRAYDQ